MHQVWDKLLFLHWPVPPAQLSALLPPQLELDLFDGSAWVSIAPFTMYGIRPAGLPALPALSESHELNVRTYVSHDGVPGVWFFSLDAANRLAVLGARAFYHLPYYHARMTLREQQGRIRFESQRIERKATHSGDRRNPASGATRPGLLPAAGMTTPPYRQPAEFRATWAPGAPVPESRAESLQYFLTERYRLYAARGEELYSARIAHRPWPLCSATVSDLESTMFEAAGIVAPSEAPLLHALSQPLHVEVWWPRRMS